MRRSKRAARRVVMLALGFVVATAAPTLAQQQQKAPTVYVTVEYMKVASGQDDAYLQVEQKGWKPLHEARVKAGKALGWYLYRVVSPTGTQADHNYVTVSIYSGFESLENPYPEEVIGKLVPEASRAEFFRKTNAARDLVRGETWETVATTPATPLAKPAPYLQVQYMRVPAGGDSLYWEVEQQWQKLHEVRIKEGTLATWGMYARVFPGGSDYPYNYATANGYEHFKDLDGFDFADLVKKANPGMSLSELGEKTSKARDLVRGEVWSLVDYVQGAR